MTKQSNLLIFTISWFLLYPILLFSNNGPVIDSSEVTRLKKEHVNEDVIVYESEINFEFKLSQNNQTVEVLETYQDVYVALNDNSKSVAYRYYDSFSDLSKEKVKKSNQDILYYKKCGDYEVNGIFFHDNKVCNYNFSIPKAGDYIQLSDKKEYFDARYLSSVELIRMQRVREMQLSFTIPDNIDVELLEMNFSNYEIAKTELYDEKTKTRIIGYKISNLQPAVLKDIAGSSWIFPHIIVVTKGYFYNGIKYSVFGSNLDLYKWYKDLIPDNSTTHKSRLISHSIIDVNDPSELKAKKIFDWVKSNIRYIAFEDGIAGYKPATADYVLDSKYGDCKGMANLLKTMLNEVGLDARLVWVGTSRLSYTNTFPSLVVHNHMICAVNLNNNFIFLDPTDRYSNIGEIGDHIHQQLAMIEDGDSYIIDTIPKTDYTDNTITANYGMILCDDILYIEGTISYLGEPRRNIQHLLNEYLGTYKKELLESLITNNNKKYNVEEIMFGIDSLNPSNFEVQVKMSAKNSVFSHDGQLLVPMDLGYGWPFPEIDTARSFHFNMGIRALKKYRTILTLPDSSSVIFLPSEIKKTINGASFRYSWKQIKNTVVFDKEINLVNKIIEPDDFKKWNSFIQEYKEAANQMIIISD